LKSKPETGKYPSKFPHWVDVAISIAQNGINKMLGNHVHTGFIALSSRYVIVNCYFICRFLPVTDSSVAVIYVGRGQRDLEHSMHFLFKYSSQYVSTKHKKADWVSQPLLRLIQATACLSWALCQQS